MPTPSTVPEPVATAELVEIPPSEPAVVPTVAVPTMEASPAVEVEASPAVELEASPAVELEASPAVEPEASPTVEPTPSSAVEPSADATVEPAPSVSVSATPSAEPSATSSATATANATASAESGATGTANATVSATRTANATVSATDANATVSANATASATANASASATPTPSATATPEVDGFRFQAGPPTPPPRLVGGEYSPSFPMWQGRSRNAPRSFSALPPTGEHPRLFFTAADLPAMRQQLLGPSLQGREGELPRGWRFNDVALRGQDPSGLLGVTSFLFTRDALEKRYPYGPPALFTGPVAPVYERLAVGDLAIDITTVDLYGSNVASAGQGREGLYGKLAAAGFVSLIVEGGNFGRTRLATALASACTLHKAVYAPAEAQGFLHDVAPDLGIAYDMLAGAMTPAQRKSCVTLMGTMIRGRREYGTGGFQRRPWVQNYNHVGWHAHIHVLAHAMEGETGDGGDEGDLWRTTLPIGIDIQRKFVANTITEGGLPRESGGYFSMGWYWALPSNIIFARRGFNVFTDPELGDHFYRGLFGFFNAQVPLTPPLRNWDGRHHDDLPSGQRPRYQCIMAWLYGDDALAQHQLANSWPVQIPTSGEAFMCAVFASDNRGNGGSAAAVAASKGMPLTHFDRDKGELTVRASWAADAVTLNFESRVDTYRVSHVHAARNSWYLYAGGRPWVIDQTRADVENVGHSTVLIDGVGQSGGGDSAGRNLWPSFPAVWNEMTDGRSLTVAAADAKYAYAYSQRCTAPYACINNAFRPHHFGYEKDPYLPGWMASESYLGRSRSLSVFNPVARAFRTVAFAKGATPFVLIVDDIQKDGADHEYEWVANVPLAGSLWRHGEEDVNVDGAYGDGGGRELVLRYTPDGLAGTPRLLLRVLRSDGEVVGGGLRVVDRSVRIRDVQVAAGKGYSTTERIRTVSFKVRAVVPRFVVLAWPFRQGQPLPETAVEGRRVTVNGRRFQLTPNADGRTRLTEV
ncbi:hypothetical protein BU14_0159s0035 [Porphyra umbilicalis]|uniref:Heparinase II N-terminal domain-containing protein n=1 Tax=Porphyra umbilicalis TaxID=2786 RepID=A0A1X6P8T8_PORUM|nr:hypothetical protein BU14_0159s0035 [Porphyra umbilicalis]|eukprot:OSX77180.1 hypothetical protein BU14_0159s0035 [Porphyra umbilicalis]